MPEYQRFITYINLYKQDEKLKNVGFAKIEKRKEQCRFEIHMKNIGYSGQNSQIYFYVRREQELECIPVGNIQMINGIADRRLLLNGENIAGSGRGLEEISGLVIFINEQVMLASQWKEGEMYRRMFRLPGQEPAASENQRAEGTQEAAAAGSQVQTSAQRAAAPGQQNHQSQPVSQRAAAPGRQNHQSQLVSQRAPAPVRQNQPSPQNQSAHQGASSGPSSEEASTQPSSEEASTQPSSEEASTQPSSQEPASQASPDQPVSQESSASLHVAEAQAAYAAPRPWSTTWQMMLESYPVLMPFEGEEEICCIRIELKELRLLPRRYWYLGNNSFLLHGFFNYRYLILGQMEVQGMKRWFLGVPGVFQNQEKVMAAIFGFPEFKAEKASKQKTNQFGYWYRFMDEQD